MKILRNWQDLVEKLQSVLDRQALADASRSARRNIVSGAMKRLGMSAGGMNVTLMVAEIVLRWDLAPVEPPKQRGAPKLLKQRAISSMEAPLSIREQVGLLEPMLERLAFQSLRNEATPPMTLADFFAAARTALLEHEAPQLTQEQLETLIRWLDERNYIYIEGTAVHVIGIPTLLPESAAT